MRLSIIPANELLLTVQNSGLVSEKSLLDLLTSQVSCNCMDLNNRGLVLLDENVASPKLGAKVIQGDEPDSLLNGHLENYGPYEG